MILLNLADFERNIWRYNPEGMTAAEKLKSYISFLAFSVLGRAALLM
jgi:hypothetical protein